MKLAALCFGCSFVCHAAVLTSLLLTDVPPSSPWSAQANEGPTGERHVVSVTFTMKTTNFGSKPAFTEPSDAEPRPSDGAPTLPNTALDAAAGEEATGTVAPSVPGERPPTTENILRELLAEPQAIVPPNASLAPLPEAAEKLDQPESIPPQLAANDPADDLLEPLTPDIAEQLERETERLDQPTERSDREQPQETPAEPTTQDTEPAEDEDTEHAEPSDNETQPAPQEASPTETDQVDKDDKPASAVYDEDSVDLPIAFDKMSRPKQSTISKRLGETGTVRIKIEVDEQGNLVKQTVLEATDYPRLLAAALNALERSTFTAAEREGEPVRSTRIIEYRF